MLSMKKVCSLLSKGVGGWETLQVVCQYCSCSAVCGRCIVIKRHWIWSTCWLLTSIALQYQGTAIANISIEGGGAALYTLASLNGILWKWTYTGEVKMVLICTQRNMSLLPCLHVSLPSSFILLIASILTGSKLGSTIIDSIIDSLNYVHKSSLLIGMCIITEHGRGNDVKYSEIGHRHHHQAGKIPGKQHATGNHNNNDPSSRFNKMLTEWYSILT